jgi:hypothetical protein
VNDDIRSDLAHRRRCLSAKPKTVDSDCDAPETLRFDPAVPTPT